MRLAASLGMPVARSEVRWFKDQVAIVVERYDRDRSPSGIVRVHQEDLCQTLSILPTKKYENEGGPGARAAVDLLRNVSGRPQEDVQRFVDALVFNWLIAGTDAHAKNYAVLIGAEGRARLAPLYDVASVLPYDFDLQRVRLAMKIGGVYRLRDIGAHQWLKLATELRLDSNALLDRIVEMAAIIPEHAADLRQSISQQGIDHPLTTRLSDALAERARVCGENVKRG
jgi:serine/threonine-protein kinase HipA